jgi:hypothetical protein
MLTLTANSHPPFHESVTEGMLKEINICTLKEIMQRRVVISALGEKKNEFKVLWEDSAIPTWEPEFNLHPQLVRRYCP